MKGRREFLKDTATGALILRSQNEFGLAGINSVTRSEVGKTKTKLQLHADGRPK